MNHLYSQFICCLIIIIRVLLPVSAIHDARIHDISINIYKTGPASIIILISLVLIIITPHIIGTIIGVIMIIGFVIPKHIIVKAIAYIDCSIIL